MIPSSSLKEYTDNGLITLDVSLIQCPASILPDAGQGAIQGHMQWRPWLLISATFYLPLSRRHYKLQIPHASK